jgi:hypothetical protein
MASIDRSDPVILGHVLAEHRELFQQIMAARTAFQNGTVPSRSRVDATVATLRSLREHLHHHFQLEEEGGFLEESIARMPRLAAAASAILHQHPALLRELDQLIGRLSAAEISAVEWKLATADFDRFSANMQAHERGENAVVQEGYNEDLGLLD